MTDRTAPVWSNSSVATFEELKRARALLLQLIKHAATMPRSLAGQHGRPKRSG